MFVCLFFCSVLFVWLFFFGGGLKLWSYCRQCYSEAIGRIYLKFCMSNFPRLIPENLPSGMFESPKCDVNPQPYTWGIGPPSRNHRSVILMHVLALFGVKIIVSSLYVNIFSLGLYRLVEKYFLC